MNKKGMTVQRYHDIKVPYDKKATRDEKKEIKQIKMKNRRKHSMKKFWDRASKNNHQNLTEESKAGHVLLNIWHFILS